MLRILRVLDLHSLVLTPDRGPGSGDQSIIVEYLLDEAGAAIPSLIGMSMVPSMLTVRSPMEVPAS
jgi:hypothetical protein